MDAVVEKATPLGIVYSGLLVVDIVRICFPDKPVSRSVPAYRAGVLGKEGASRDLPANEGFCTLSRQSAQKFQGSCRVTFTVFWDPCVI